MAKKKVDIKQDTHMLTSPLEEIMSDRFARYSKYIIQDRALPDARDGLKPVQRRILYAMYEDGNTYDKPYRKSAKTVGLVIGNYHPHGDSSVYDAMVRMSQDWKIRIPIIDMQGNNGSIDDDPAAAMRYTEARLSKISSYLLEDIHKDTVSWAPNFDDTVLEPTVLPARYPNLLVHGISGIAAGYATNIPPHNLKECLEACIHRVQHPNCTLEDIMQFIKGPDFPTGGIIQGKQGIIDAFTTGKGRIIVRSKVEIENTKTLQQIIVTEIPYEVVKSNMIKKIDEIRLTKKIDGIMDVRDESDRNGLRVVIDVKKDLDIQQILNYLYKNTDLQVSYNYNVIAIENKRPVQMGLLQMIDAFVDHRRDVILKRSKFDLDKKEARCHILEGLIRAISILDEIIKIIRHSKDKKDAKINLIQAYDFSEEQAEAIVTMRLYRLTNTDVVELKKEFEQLQKEIKQLKEIISNPKQLNKVMINEFKEVKKELGLPRLSHIEDEIEEIVIDKTAMIASEQVIACISRDAYFKRVSMRSFSATNGVLCGLKDSDRLIAYREVNTLDTLLFFTTTGTYGYLPIYELEEYKWKDVGSHINGKLKISPEEKISDVFIANSFETNAYIITITRFGMIKRSAVKDFMVTRNNKTMMNMKLMPNDEVIKTLVAYDQDEIMILTKNGFLSRYTIENIPLTNTRGKGVKAMNLVEDELVDACIYHSDQSQLIAVTNEGEMKRIRLNEIDLNSRNVKGSMICKKRKTNPYILQNILLMNMNEEISLIGENITKIQVKDIPLINKTATFSHIYKEKTPFYIPKVMETIKIVEFPEQEEKTHKFEEFSIFDTDL